MSSLFNLADLFWPAAATAAVFGFYLAKKWLFPQKKSSIVVAGEEQQKSRLIDGPERIRTSIFAENDQDFIVNYDPRVTTLYESFLNGLKVSKNGPCLGSRTGPDGRYEFITYQEVLDRAHAFGSGLLELDLKPDEENFIGIYSQNRAEWHIAAFGCMAYSLIIVPFYDSLGGDSVTFIVNQADMKIVLCDNATKVKKLLDSAAQLPSLRHIVVMEWSRELIGEDVEKLLRVHRIQLHSFKELIEIGKQNAKPLKLPKADDLYIVCYTSGTTGRPKGVMISHTNVLSQVTCLRYVFDRYGIGLVQSDSVMSYLPLAHMFEQLSSSVVFSYGAQLGYFRGNIANLLDDMKALSPSCFPVVPRLLNRLHDKIQSNLSAAGGIKKLLFNFAYNSKLAEMHRGIIRNDGFWDKLVFGKVQKELGGKLRLMVTGSAPIAEEVLTLSRVMLGAVILEAYGQTEATASVMCTLPGEMKAGHVGGPLPCAHVKLVDVPELQYFAKDDKGEICIRGPCVSRGYFKDPELSAEAFDEDGWVHTGDIGMWQEDGSLKIVDRKKHIFKLAQGEYVAPEKIENIYMRSPFVAQIFVDGNSLQKHLVAIVVPEESILQMWADENELGHLDYDQLCGHKTVKAMILSELQQTGKQHGLNSLEQVQAIHISPEAFSLENGLLTPTMKSKRPLLRKRYSSRVEELYKKFMD